jgi:hypothetical protein
MTPESNQTQSKTKALPPKTRLLHSYYAILGVHPSASPLEIRKAYRDLSKKYHPDTTYLSSEVATMKFQQLNEAYGTLSNPERRSLYDAKIGYSRGYVVQPLPSLREMTEKTAYTNNSAYLDPSDRPLSAGEIFALVLLLLTFGGCLLLAVILAMLRGDPMTISAIFTTNNYDFPFC